MRDMISEPPSEKGEDCGIVPEATARTVARHIGRFVYSA